MSFLHPKESMIMYGPILAPEKLSVQIFIFVIISRCKFREIGYYKPQLTTKVLVHCRRAVETLCRGAEDGRTACAESVVRHARQLAAGTKYIRAHAEFLQIRSIFVRSQRRSCTFGSGSGYLNGTDARYYDRSDRRQRHVTPQKYGKILLYAQTATVRLPAALL